MFKLTQSWLIFRRGGIINIIPHSVSANTILAYFQECILEVGIIDIISHNVSTNIILAYFQKYILYKLLDTLFFHQFGSNATRIIGLSVQVFLLRSE